MNIWITWISDLYVNSWKTSERLPKSLRLAWLSIINIHYCNYYYNHGHNKWQKFKIDLMSPLSRLHQCCNKNRLTVSTREQHFCISTLIKGGFSVFLTFCHTNISMIAYLLLLLLKHFLFLLQAMYHALFSCVKEVKQLPLQTLSLTKNRWRHILMMSHHVVLAQVAENVWLSREPVSLPTRLLQR